MLAAKHFDAVLGIDVHIVVLLVEGLPVPTPMPNPFVGFVFDPHDYLPPHRAKVLVNGLPRAHAGTGVVALVPHLPIGGPFLKQPVNKGELFMGSSTVIVEGEPMGYALLPVLTCSDLGMPAPLRARKKDAVKSALLPSSILIPIPAFPFVLIGGTPTISMPAPGDVIGGLTRIAKLVRKAQELAGPLAHLLKRACKASPR